MKLLKMTEEYVFISCTESEYDLAYGHNLTVIPIMEDCFTFVRNWCDVFLPKGPKENPDYWEDNVHDKIVNLIAGASVDRFNLKDISNAVSAVLEY